MSVEDQIVARLQEKDPNIDVRPGTAIYEFFVKPLVSILAPLQSEIDDVKTFLSITNAEDMPAGELDQLAGNFFVTRKEGIRSAVTVRIFVNAASDILLDTGAVATATNGQTFTNTEPFTFSESEIVLNQDGELFFFDVVMVSLEKTEEANIEADEIVSINTLVPGFDSITNPFPSVGGQREETNEELVERIKTSIALRNLVTERGIGTILPESFEDIFEVRSIGFGDPEMHRDIRVGVHVGGHVDVYLASSEGFTDAEAIFDQSLVDPTEDAEGLHITIREDPIAGIPAISNVPIVRVTKVEIGSVLGDGTFSPSAELVEDEDWTLIVKDAEGLPAEAESAGQHFRFSIREILDLQVDADHSGNDFRITYEWASFVAPVQAFVEEVAQRVVCADVLAKIFVPAFIDMSLVVTQGPDASTAEEQVTAIEEFIETLRSPSVFELSDIVALLYDLGVDQVDIPTTIISTVIKPDGSAATISSENEIDFSVIEDPSVPLTARIIHTHPGTISIVEKQTGTTPS